MTEFSAVPAYNPYHALRREELFRLKVKDFKHERRGVPHLKVFGKGGKIRYIPLHPAASGLIGDYLEVAGHGADDAGALFRPLRNNCTTGGLERAITPDAVYKLVRQYSVRPTRLTTRPTSPRCRSGWVTPTSPRPEFTTTARPGRRTVRRSRWPTREC